MPAHSRRGCAAPFAKRQKRGARAADARQTAARDAFVAPQINLGKTEERVYHAQMEIDDLPLCTFERTVGGRTQVPTFGGNQLG
jgi:hypothetical protein